MTHQISSSTLSFLSYQALNLRINSLRMTTQSGSGHPTSCLSAADMIAVLFFKTLRYNYQDPAYANNDRFILSNGHGCALQYSLLHLAGFKLPMEELKLDIIEVTNPDADAHIVAYSVAEALEKRLPFRRVMKQAVERVIMTRGVEGVKIVISGRLGGAEIARIEEQKRGSIPLQTFRADVDYTRERAHMTYGDIGIKVWIYRGEVFNEKKEGAAQAAPATK